MSEWRLSVEKLMAARFFQDIIETGKMHIDMVARFGII